MRQWFPDMSELQIGLIAMGLIAVMAVVFFNWAQQRRYRRHAEEAFGRKHEDVLLEPGALGEADERIEPRLGGEVDASLIEPDTEPVVPPEIIEPDAQTPLTRTTGREQARMERVPRMERVQMEPVRVEPVRAEQPHVEQHPLSVAEDSVTDGMDYVVHIRAETPIPNSELGVLMGRRSDFGKPVRWLGRRDPEAFWEDIASENHSGMAKTGYIELRGCLQLADRTGPLSEATLSEFRDMAENFAANLKATANSADVHKAYERAVLLDEFCTKVDVMAGINIISRDNSVFTGAKIRVLAETSGFKFGNDGLFHYCDENNATLFSLGNYEPSPFLPDNIRTLTTRGITLLLDVPKVANGEAAFGQMVHLAEVFKEALGGIMVDDNRALLSDSGIRKIKQQLSAIQSTMLARNIPAGSETALRLFA
jgi:hypothetical protein